jgi:hypothetical protein
MILQTAASGAISYGILGSGANSSTALFVDKEAQRGRRLLQESRVLGFRGKGAFDELNQVYAECLEPNWDGYGAMPVSNTTYRLAYEFLDAFPLGMPLPSFGAEPDGHLTLEWHHSPRWTLSVSVSPERELHYAALLGASKMYGTEPFFGEIPSRILDLIRQVSFL